MGHNIEHRTYSENIDHKKVQKELDEYVRQACYQEGSSGLPYPIRWLNPIVESIDAAYEYIDSVDKGWYDQIAVRYYDYKKTAPTKKETELLGKISTAHEKYYKLKNNIHYKGIKSAYVACKKCGSKLATKYICTNSCPMCNAELRPATTLAQIEKLEENLVILNQQLKKETSRRNEKNKKNATIKWLVKIEYHM